MKYWKFFIPVLLLTNSLHVCGQEKFKTLKGKITDAQNRQVIPSATLQLKKGAAGTATNSSGDFIFKIPESGLSDTLVISCIGYRSTLISLSSVVDNVQISLQPAVVEMAAVTVRSRSGLDILKEALGRIPVNYDTSDVQLTAFYRENVWLGDYELSFSEAILDIYKTFKTGKKLNDQLKIIKGRKKSIDYGKEAQLYWWMSGVSNGARNTLGNDMVKYRAVKSSPFNPSNFRFYEYKFLETINEGNRNLIVLTINPRKKARKGLVHMKLYIDEESLAIIKYTIDISEKGVRQIERKDKGIAYGIMSKVLHITTDYHKFQITVSYNQVKEKWYLNRVTQHFEIFVNSKRRNWEDRLWRSDRDLIVTGVKTTNVKPILEGDIGDKEAPMHTLISGKYDEEFWEHYNILKSEISDSVRNSIANTPEKDTIASVRKDITSSVEKDTTVSIEKGTTSSVEKDDQVSDPIRLQPDPYDSAGSVIQNTVQSLTDDTLQLKKIKIPNRENGFTRADTLRGKLTPLRTCYDVTFYHLDVAIDMFKRSVKGNNLIRFKVEQPFVKMQVDLFNDMKIDSILYKNESVRYTREFNAVFIDFPATLQRGDQAEIRIYYEGVPKTPNWMIPMDGGVLWDKDSLGNNWAQMVCQGSGASLWWPNKDHQSDEPDSMQIWITVPSEFTEISNGRLIEKTPMSGNQTRYEWKVSYPINNYNVTFSIGKYVHYQDRYISDDTLTIDYYVMPYNLDRAKKMFGQVKPMLKTFQKYFGKYPFPRDGFTLVESLYPMEHQSGVCIGKITAQNSGDTNPLLWHESAHEWWGNSITSKDIADMWIHEAFATYAETLMIEDLFGKDKANISMTEQVDAVSGKEPVTGVYDVNHIHYDIGDMYSKGSLMLHTFRNVLNNDTLWIKLLRDIQNHFRYQTLSADELIKFINQQTNTDYTYFFDQYLHFTDPPILEVKLQPSGKNLSVKYRWVTNVKNFRMPVKVTKTADRFGFIYPTTEWKTVVLKNVSMSEFEVDEENFYIETQIE